LPDGRLKELISVEAYGAGQEYMRIVEQELAPAIDRGDKKGTQIARARAIAALENCVRATKSAVDITHDKQVELDEKGRHSATTSLLLLLGIGLLVAVVVAFLGYTISRGVSSGASTALAFANTIAEGNLNTNDMELDGKDEMSELMHALNTMKNGLKERTALNERMAALADKTAVNIIFADNDLNIRYVNAAAHDTLQKLEKYLPARANEILGKSIDIFHKDSARVRRMLADPRNLPCSAKIELGPETIELKIDRVSDSAGHPPGMINTWAVVTEAQRFEALNADYAGQIAAIGKSQAVVEFCLDGKVMGANENFLRVMGYTLDEIKDHHHSMFVDEATRNASQYQQFWAKLDRGEYIGGEFKRVAKGGREIWLQANYNPIADKAGKLQKVVKYATEITEQKLKYANYEGQLDAINRSQGVIEFKMDGTVITANPNFLSILGYRLDEVLGKHHSMFVEDSYRRSAEYGDFWQKLNRGESIAQEFKRVGKNGKEVWLQASYNPILDLNGNPFKVVKYAMDISEAVIARENVKAAVERDKLAAEEMNRKVDSILQAVGAAAEGDLTQNITITGTDAVGQMAEGLRKFFGDLRASMASIGKTAQSLTGASEEVTNQGQQMSANSEETSAQANVVAKATQQVNENLQSVATGAEEMTLTVRSIASNASEAAKVAGEAVKTAQAANETVSKLGESSAEIGQVIKVITSIAQQTNLLALNATIEAARAGEAGKGFAVVANEVKELAKQTAKATEEISQKITTIQHDTKGAVEAIGAIGETINKINEISTTIATAVEEQSATTNEMSRNVAEAATGSGEISQNIQGVAQAAEGTATSAQGAQKSALELAEMAAQLRSLVERFKIEENASSRAQARAASAAR
jgi:methyl-accepting chemotaxis protein